MFSSEFDILIKLMKLALTRHRDCVTTPCVCVWNTHFAMLNLIIEEMLTGHLTLAACQLHPIWAPQLRLRALTHPLQATNYNREFCLVIFIMYLWRGGGHFEANHSTTNQVYWALSLDFCSQMIWHWHASSKMAMPKPEAQKVWIFRMANFNARKLSGRSA